MGKCVEIGFAYGSYSKKTMYLGCDTIYAQYRGAMEKFLFNQINTKYPQIMIIIHRNSQVIHNSIE